MTTIERSIGHGDFILHRYGEERIGCLWEEQFEDGCDPKDLSGWTAELTLENDLGETVAKLDCVCTSDGYVFADIPVSITSSEDFAACNFGSWRIVGTDGTSTELIADGNFEIV